MKDATNHADGRGHRRGIRLRRAGPLAAALVVGLALFAAACSSGLPGPGASHGRQHSTPSTGLSSGTRSLSGVTVAFAKCMRSHGVPHFPNPNGNRPVFGPGSGIDPTSPQFQHALGACKFLAPPTWVSAGPVTPGPSRGVPGGAP
jgi:hypothetical protein